MRTLIVLCAGGTKIDGIPLYLCKHPDGKLIAQKAIHGVYAESYDRIVFTILEEEDKYFDATRVLEETFSKEYNIKIVRLPRISEGPADTVYQTLLHENIEGEIAIRDSLGCIELKDRLEGNFIVGVNLLTYNDSIQRIKSKGFIIANEQNIVLDFLEKRFCSDIVSVGFYGFKKADDFIASYRRLTDPTYSIPRISVGHVMSHLIGYKGRKFQLGYVDVFEDWGDQAAWYYMQKHRATIFIDLDMFNLEELDRQTIKKMRIVSENGMKIIFYYSSKCPDEIRKYKNILQEAGIKFVDIIDRCGGSSEKYLIDSIEDFKKLTIDL